MFADEKYLLLLLLIPIFAVFFYFAYTNRKKALELFISNVNLPLLSNVKLSAYPLKSAFFIFGLFFLILALARPQYGDTKQTVVRESAEIAVALDISKSMLAKDVQPNRLEKAKFTLLRTIEDNPGQKIGAIVFSGSAMWQCPMTYDSEALKMFLQGVSVGQLPLGGTQISGAILLASKALESSSARGKILLLISDGEDHDSKIDEAIAEAQKTNLKIVSVGIGSHEGAPIPVEDGGAVKDYVKDRNGQIVMSKLNPVLLKRIAQETGGKYFDASSKDVLPSIIKTIKELEKNKDEIQERTAKADRFQIFLFLSLIMFFVWLLIPLTKSAKIRLN
ncbi:MAG: VWA domain-containing protein [Endomicrobium sp.]|jgi:Ca-activated chloride channel family protein|nr:VWA domain-containing protein [Endomicrobium sp.]